MKRLDIDLGSTLGPVTLRTPIIAASGTVGSVVDFAGAADFRFYGAAVAKSVSSEPWPGRPAPRLGSAGVGMLNGIGIQNPGVAAWIEEVGPRIETVPVPIWGSAIGHDAGGFAEVAVGMERAGVAAIEVNLSCPNLEDGHLFALDPVASAGVVRAVRSVTGLPIGAKLSPNAVDIVEISAAVQEAGADWVVLTNTAWGAGFDVNTRRPTLSGVVGGYSGAPLKPIALRCVWQVAQALPDLPIVGCGGVRTGEDVVEYLLAGASAVAVGTAHFAEPRIGRRIVKELERYMKHNAIVGIDDLVGGAEPW
ncbi:MAG TPA: dihydroorotate dehydrogenase [Acidimicrobiia bacterium]|nr:dihydroorotate dehydrogenase [Acidimicrobiia bacterium]